MSKESIKEIDSRLKMAEDAEREQLMKVYAPDDRAGVQKLLEKYRKQKEKLLAEKERLAKMRQYEEKYADYAFICGIDEVGRGPLAGPVVAGAVILPKECEILYINDSKKLSAAKRDELYDEIMDKAVAVVSGWLPLQGLTRSIFCRQHMRQCVWRSAICQYSRICC